MEINFAIVSSDESHYLDYWPIVSEAWSWKMDITPILVRIVKGIHPKSENSKYGTIINLPEIPNIKSSLQAQIGRIWAYKMLSGNCIMSDIDMLPISKSYYKDIAEKYNEDQIVSYCSDAAKKFDGYHPMCYILANTKVMSSLIKEETWEQFVLHLADIGGQGWSTDQWHVTNLLNSYDKVVSLNRGWNSAGQANNRLDRIDWNYDNATVKNYYDAHLPQPYMKNKELIANFLQCVNK